MSMEKKSESALKSWRALNLSFVRKGRDKLTLSDLETMLAFEKSSKGARRKTFIKRLQQRINSLNIKKHTVKV